MNQNTKLEQFKEHISEGNWQKERCRWECVKWFQEHWKPEVSVGEFAPMLEKSLEKLEPLLELVDVDRKAFANMKKFIHDSSENQEISSEIKGLFENLFDERGKLWNRIQGFQNGMLSLFEKYGAADTSYYWYFSETVVTIFLWLKFPDKYFIYKFWEARTAARLLGLSYEFEVGEEEANIENAHKMYGEIGELMKRDEELTALVQSYLDSSGCQDPEGKILTGAFVGFICAQEAEKDPDNSPSARFFSGLQPYQWAALLRDSNIFHADDMEMLRRMKDHKSWKGYEELFAQEEGAQEKKDYYGKVTRLSWRLIHKVGCPAKDSKGVIHTNYVDQKETMWKLWDALSEAIYTKKDFLSQVYMEPDQFEKLKGVLFSKKNIILQGVPGVGKTFTARRLAYAMMGEKDDGRIQFVQFHQSYSYEDFVMGYRPFGQGFELHYGIFYQFCQEASRHPKLDYFFIIDEINRGNISKIFGELLMLMEKDYRGTQAVLAYDGKPFSVPENLYIIGMMNTADRNLTILDYALRRRFSFFEIWPGFDTAGFSAYEKSLHNPRFQLLIKTIENLNQAIEEDRFLGKGFCIGHSYFCGCTCPEDCTDQWMKSVVDYDIMPMLEEYWIDNDDGSEKLKYWKTKLDGVFDDKR